MSLSLSTIAFVFGAIALSDAQGPPAKPAEQEKKDPYEEAIKGYTAKDGLFKLFQKEDSYMIEIPSQVLGRDLLWYSEVKEAPQGGFSGSMGPEGVVKWEVRGDKVFLRSVSYGIRATEGNEIKKAVAMANVAPIIEAFPIKAKSPKGDPLIDVTRFFASDIPEFSMRGSLGGQSLDSQRTYIDAVKVFPENMNVHVTMTFRGGGGAGGGFGFGAPAAKPSITGMISHSIVLLPEKPMMGRLWDSRVGYFDETFTDYGTDYHGAKELRYISRYRLEKKNPNAPISDPVKPIVYYVAKEVPAKWRPYCHKAIEDWQVAFREAGFSNAIIAKDQPDDPDWSAEDVRHSMIRWAPLPIANAIGPHVHDPRSGEILSAHVIMWHDILKLQTDWYFIQASPSDPKSRRLPLSDELQGELVRFVVAHEVGHTLGLPHNGKSSAMVPVAKLRDPIWTKANGTAGSIMDYARFNYVAQPGDGAALIPQVGAYDKYSIRWGYTPIPGARTPKDEVPQLDKWSALQVTNPLLRFYDNFSGADPTAQAEALGDDAVLASTYGVANLKRVVTYLRPATEKLGEDYSELGRMHSELMGQMMNYIGHVNAVVGGVELVDFRAGRGGAPYRHVPRDYQKRAVQWQIENVLKAPTWIAPADIVSRIGNGSPLSPVSTLQTMALNGLWNENRLSRMNGNALMNGGNAYTIAEMANAVRGAVWGNLAQRHPIGNAYDRNLQRTYVNLLVGRIGSRTETRAYVLTELRAQLDAIRNAVPRTQDRLYGMHLRDLQANIEMALRNPPPAAPATQQPFSPFGADDGHVHHIRGCSLGGIVRD